MKITNKQVFSRSIFDLPKAYQSYFPAYLVDLFSDFSKAINDFQGSVKTELEQRNGIIRESMQCITKAVEDYYKGYPALAYKKLSKTLNSLEKVGVLPIQRNKTASKRSLYYRVRVSESKNLRKEDLFHIPFEMREKVSTQRYSISGLPCLYLGDSAYVCWEEMNRPSLELLHISRFDLTPGNFKLLYFNTNAEDIRKRCFGKNEDGLLVKSLVSFLCCWPLLAACSVIVRKPVEVFKPEYIIPQLLLQWIVAMQKIDGILYRSNRVKASASNIGTFSNVVLPVKKIGYNGFCPELSGKIKLTNPITAQLLAIVAESPISYEIDVDDLRRVMYLELFEGERTVYSDTKFSQLEAKLEGIRAEVMKTEVSKSTKSL